MQEIIPDDPLLDQARAAMYIDTAPRTLETWRYQGRGPAYIKVGNSVRYRKSAIDSWLDAQTVNPSRAA